MSIQTTSKAILKVYQSLERKVFVALANIWYPVTARRVAEIARIDINKTSALLNRLESRGIITIHKRKVGKEDYKNRKTFI